jgi:pimeloyl-ACP methyl ester carboxylesterase
MRGTARLFLIALAAVALVLLAFTVQAGRRESRTAREIAPSGGRFVPAADVEMFVQERGPTDGPAVLFVHGTGAWSETWRESLTALADAGFRAVAIDLPPFGFSSRPEPDRYGKRDQARRIVGALDALGIGRVVLVGHSFGGGPTVEAVLLAPERVRALVLVDAALGVSETGERELPSALLAGFLAARPLRDGVVATFLTNPLYTRRLLQSFIADPAKATPSSVAVYQRPLAVKGSTRAVGAWLQTLLAPVEASDSELPATYRSLGMPVRLVWGALDTITPLDQARLLVGLVPGAELEVMEGVGHIPQIEDPREFNERLLRLLGPFSSSS